MQRGKTCLLLLFCTCLPLVCTNAGAYNSPCFASINTFQPGHPEMQSLLTLGVGVWLLVARVGLVLLAILVLTVAGGGGRSRRTVAATPAGLLGLRLLLLL